MLQHILFSCDDVVNLLFRMLDSAVDCRELGGGVFILLTQLSTAVSWGGVFILLTQLSTGVSWGGLYLADSAVDCRELGGGYLSC